MRDRPLASVLVNNYDCAAFLRAAIDSALAQTYDVVEVVVVDDGSTDDSRAIIASYGDRVRAVCKENGGQASALNEGFRHCRGDVIFILDADDVLAPEAVQAVMDVWRDGVVKVQFFLEVVDADGRPLGSRLPPDRPLRRSVRDLLLHHGGYPSTGTTGNGFSRALLERILPVPESEWRRFPDMYINLLAPLFGEVVWVNRTLGAYRVHGGNQWTVDRVRLDRIHEALGADVLREQALRRWSGELGIEVPAEWILRFPNHLHWRLASLVLEPEQHPYAGDRRWRLAVRGVRASLSAPPFRWRKRVFFAAWFVLTGLLPRRPARYLVELGFSRFRRPALLHALIS